MSTATEDDFLKIIDFFIDSLDLNTAEMLCCKALDYFPDGFFLNFKLGIVFELKGQSLEAKVIFEKLAISHPDIYSVELKLASIAIKNKNVAEAESRLEAAFDKNAKESSIQYLSIDLARLKGDIEGECLLLESFVECRSSLPITKALRLVDLYIQLSFYGKALRLLQRVLTLDFFNIKAYVMMLRVAENIGDCSLLERALLRLLDIDKFTPKWYLKAQIHFINNGDPLKAEEVLRLGVSRGLSGCILFKKITSFTPSLELFEPALKWALSIGSEASEAERSLAQNIYYHLNPLDSLIKDKFQICLKSYQTCEFEWLALSPSDDELMRPVTLELLNNEIQISRAAGSKTVVLVFLGVGNQAMLPIAIFDRFLAALGCSAIYIKDNSRFFGNLGIASVADSFESTLDYFRGAISELGAQRIITIGVSAGGFSATRYGLALGSEKIINFSGVTNFTSSFLENDGREKILARRMQALPSDMLDVKPWLLNANASSSVYMVYGNLNPQDTMHANYIKGCPGVYLYSLPDIAEHGVVRILVLQKKLYNLFVDLIGFE